MNNENAYSSERLLSSRVNNATLMRNLVCTGNRRPSAPELTRKYILHDQTLRRKYSHEATMTQRATRARSSMHIIYNGRRRVAKKYTCSFQELVLESIADSSMSFLGRGQEYYKYRRAFKVDRYHCNERTTSRT